MNVKGMTINDIMNLSWDDLNKLSLPKLKEVTSRLVSASNKRIRRLSKTDRGESSFAYQSVEERGRKFSVRNKDINSVKNEFKIAKKFLQMKTSTVRGWKEYKKDVETRTGYATENESRDWSERTWKKYWKVYRRFEESHGGTYKKGDSDRIQKMLTEIMDKNDKRRSADTFQQMIEDEYNEMYKSRKSTKINDAFTIDDEEE